MPTMVDRSLLAVLLGRPVPSAMVASETARPLGLRARRTANARSTDWMLGDRLMFLADVHYLLTSRIGAGYRLVVLYSRTFRIMKHRSCIRS